MFRDRQKGMQILLRMTQTGPGRAVKQEQEEISRNLGTVFLPGPVYYTHGGLEMLRVLI